MREFIDLCLTPPALLFTILMVPVGLYWALSVLGAAVDHVSDVGNAADGVHGPDWHAPDAHGGDFHGDAHGEVHGDAHGHHHGPGDFHGRPGSGDLAQGHHASWGGISFGEVPKVLSLSLLVFFGWTSSLAALYFYPPLAEMANRALWIGAAFSAVAFALAFGATALAVRPINKLLTAGAGPTRSDLVGKLCTIRTQRVDASFGQAEVDHASSVVQVRDPQGRGFRYGQRAVIFDYDSDKEVFYIAPFDQETLKLELPAGNPARTSEPPPASSPVVLPSSAPSSPKSPAARRGEPA